MAIIHICAENRAEAVSSGKNGQRAERQERPDKLKPNSYSTQNTLSSDAIALLCLCVEVFTQSGRAVIATTCTMSDLPKNKLILHTGLTPHTRSQIPFHVQVGMRDGIKEMKEREDDDIRIQKK